MSAITLKIVMDDADFGYLFDNAGLWQETRNEWARFHVQGVPYTASPASRWTRIYWFSNRVNVILARAFLQAWGHEYQEAIDTAQDDAPWVIVTGYEWKQEG